MWKRWSKDLRRALEAFEEHGDRSASAKRVRDLLWEHRKGERQAELWWRSWKVAQLAWALVAGRMRPDTVVRRAFAIRGCEPPAGTLGELEAAVRRRKRGKQPSPESLAKRAYNVLAEDSRGELGVQPDNADTMRGELGRLIAMTRVETPTAIRTRQSL